MNGNRTHLPWLDQTLVRALFPTQLTLASIAFAALALAPLAQAQQPAATTVVRTDATFAFTADVHTSFDGYDDHQGIDDYVFDLGGNKNDLLLLGNETDPSVYGNPTAHSDGCGWDSNGDTGFSSTKDLCNQIQLVRKLNHLPVNKWYGLPFTQQNGGHTAKLFSGGDVIGTPKGLFVGGDLTDCGAGSDNVEVWEGGGQHSENCDIDYKNGIPGAELTVFKQLFDKAANTKFMPLSMISVIKGLKDPDGDVPLQYPVYPSLGNHDLGFDKSGLMMNYIRQWNIEEIPTSPYHVTNNDFNSGDYSVDWGRLHVVDVGVFAGANNNSGATPSTNYPYSDDTMNWIRKDLASYASDGRPVVLVQHFCFDSLSMGWYEGEYNKAGLANLWSAIAPYNVVGIYCGHQHTENMYAFHPGTPYNNGVPFPTPRMPYDIFETGPGFGQDFMLTRVTDKFMDVEATSEFDFDNTQDQVPFANFFNKRLVATPTPGLPSPVEAGDYLATSVTFSGRPYIVGVTAAGKYTLREITGPVSTQVVSTGSLKVEPKLLLSYVFNGQSYILASDGNILTSYVITAQRALKLAWLDGIPMAGMTVAHAPNGAPFLLVDEAGSSSTVRLQFYELSASKISAAVGSYELGGQRAGHSQMFAIQQEDGNFVVVRYTGGGAEIYNGLLNNYGNCTLSLGSRESWVGDSAYAEGAAARPNVFIQPVTLQDSSIGILVKSPACLKYGLNNVCVETNNIDSPYSVRTLTQDSTGTEISWRGRIFPLIDANTISVFPLLPVGGVPQVGLYTSNGLFSTIAVHD